MGENQNVPKKLRKEEVTKEQFAKWSFERDMRLDITDNIRWEDTSQEEKDLYLDEANFYFTDEKMKDDWPLDIMVRLEVSE